jgi:hypothetical protein
LLVDAGVAGIRLWSAESSVGLAAVKLDWLDVLAIALVRALLVCFAIEEKVAEDPAWAPEETVGPALDATLVFVEHEHGARGDHFALRIDEAAGDSGNEASASRLEDEEGIPGGLYPAGPRGLCPGRGAGMLGCGHGPAAWMDIVRDDEETNMNKVSDERLKVGSPRWKICGGEI